MKDGYAVRYKLLRNGKRQILNVILPGDVVGLPGSLLRARGLFGHRHHRPAHECLCARFYVELCYRHP